MSQSREQRKADIYVGITLAEHAAGLLTAITREAPRLDLGSEIARINRQILAMQGRLIDAERKLDLSEPARAGGQ